MKHIRLPLVVYFSLLLLLMIFEESLIFMPSRHPVGDWKPVGLNFEDAHFQAADDVRLHGWYFEAAQPRTVILFCHGNAGNITHRADVARRLLQLDASVLLFDYRGYGRSQGRPNESGVLADARAARAWLAQRAGVDPREIVLMGRSLGAAVAIDLAAADGARALVVESSFTTLPDMAAVHYPWAPVGWLMRSRFDSLGKIKRYAGPLLQSHGDLDEIVPFEQGQRLYEAAASRDKQFHIIPGGRHNDFLPPDYYQQLDAFLERLE